MAEDGIADGLLRTADSRKLWSRPHKRCHFCLCLFFLMTVFLVIYSTKTLDNTADWSPGSWMKHNATTWWEQFKGITNKFASVEANDVDGNTLDAAGLRHRTNTSVSTQAEAVSPTQTPEVETTPAKEPLNITQQTTLNLVSKAVPPAPVPYVSPGPYMVEYPSEYHFVINQPQKCRQQNPFLVLMVPVAPQNREDRDIIRSTWGSERVVLGKVVSLFFLLGLPKVDGADQIQQQVQQESEEKQDLLQANFLDCYKNLTIKTMVMLEWLDNHCPTASYAMKVDSDVFLNPQNLVNMLRNTPKENYMTGLVTYRAHVQRDPTSKWFLPVDLFPESSYPPYALGLGYILSLDLPKKLVEASRHVKALYIEDVYLGLCMSYLHILPTSPQDKNWFHFNPLGYSRCSYSKIIATTITTTTKSSDRVRVWKDFNRAEPFC